MTAPPAPVPLTRAVLLRLLDRLDTLPAAETLSVILPPGATPPALPPAVAAALDRLGPCASGAILYWGEAAGLALEPPFAPDQALVAEGYATAPLRELLTRPRALGVILLRLGGYSAGIYRDGAFTVTKTGGRFVKNRHRKGGQSQRRFDRIREKQVREHFDDVDEVVRSRLLPAAATLDHVVLGGDRHTVAAYLKRAPLPTPLAAKLLPRVIATPEPRLEVLERAPTLIWSSRAVLAHGFAPAE